MARVETQFPCTPAAPQLSRAFVRAALQTWELDGFGEVTELLTDELVSNAVRHVGSPVTVRAYAEGATLRVEVDDSSTDPPVLVQDAPGRGMLIVDALATHWGTNIRDDAKTVWFEIDVSTATREIHGAD